MTATIKTQNFGVEIEMNNMSRSRAQKIVADALGSTQTGYSSSYDNHYVIDAKGRQWKCESDSSIKNVGRGTCELVTPVLQYEDISEGNQSPQSRRSKDRQQLRNPHPCGRREPHTEEPPHNAQVLRRTSGPHL